MGRRSTSSTKDGKFVNPTDQARKEARKRELKKNKKQRAMHQAEVLRLKDPKQIIRDMEKLDEMEFNPMQQPQFSEEVLNTNVKGCVKPSNEFYDFMKKEDPDFYKELRMLEVICEQKRAQLSQYFNAVRNAQHVDINSISLPDKPQAFSNIMTQNIPLPGAQPPLIFKKASAHGPPTPEVSILSLGQGVPCLPPGRKPPGPPGGPPPPQVLQMYGWKVGFALALPPHRRHQDMLCSSDGDNPEEKSGLGVPFADMPGKSRMKNVKELTPVQAMMLRMVGQISENVPEMELFPEDDDEEDSGDSEMEKPSQKHKEESHSGGGSASSLQQAAPQSSAPQIQAPPVRGPLPLGPPPAPPLRPPGPPPVQPPGPPPELLPGLRPGPPPRGPPPSFPPPAPPGIPPPCPNVICPPLVPPLGAAPPEFFLPAPLHTPGVLSTLPNCIQLPKINETSSAIIQKKATAIISAKTQITNPNAEITKFVPTALRVRRENKGATAIPQKKSGHDSAAPLPKQPPDLVLLFLSRCKLVTMSMKSS